METDTRAAALADDVPDSERVLFLTIVGDQTYLQWGRVGDRPPRIDAISPGSQLVAVAENLPPDAGLVAVEEDSGVNTAMAINTDYGGVERPYGPAPQECPRTLPPGSDHVTADTLLRQSGCRYLSTCSMENDVEECTWYYQGRVTGT
jgi:hypothetical protein